MIRSHQFYLRVRRYIGIGGVLIILFIFLSITQATFLTKENLINILRASSIIFILAMGCTFNMLTAGFDLSVESEVALSGLILAVLLHAGVPAWPAIFLVLLIGAFLGFTINGLLIGKLRVSFFVVTLGTMIIYRSTVYVCTNGKTIYIDKWPVIRAMADGVLWGIPIPFYLMLLVFVASYVVLKHTTYGKSVYGVGGNRAAAILSGINAGLVEASVYGISSFLAALAGILQAGRLAAASPVAGTGIALQVAAVVLLGGTSFSGGIGGVVGTVLGVFFLSILENGLGVAGVSTFWQGVITGAILITAVIFDTLQTRRRV